jgi:hypothetical protein
MGDVTISWEPNNDERMSKRVQELMDSVIMS